MYTYFTACIHTPAASSARVVSRRGATPLARDDRRRQTRITFRTRATSGWRKGGWEGGKAGNSRDYRTGGGLLAPLVIRGTAKRRGTQLPSSRSLGIFLAQEDLLGRRSLAQPRIRNAETLDERKLRILVRIERNKNNAIRETVR